MFSDSLIKYPIIVLALLLRSQSIALAAATDSTNVNISSGAPGTILLLASGYINFGSTPVSNFVINQVCPSGFRPYVTLDLTKVKFVLGNEEVITGFGACIMNNNSSPTSYTIFYQVARRFERVRNIVVGGFVSNSNASFGLANAVPRPTRLISSGDSIDSNTVGGFQWHLYCFPLSVALPLNQTNFGATFCNFGDNPF